MLAISPRFAPSNSADSHRLRLLAAHAAAAGWDVEVLAVEPADVADPVDDWLVEMLPVGLQVHRVTAPRLPFWGMNGLTQRCIRSMYRAGCRLLSSGRFDFVLFSTTEFGIHLLGPIWKRRFGIPFGMDFQDPWVNDFYSKHPDIVPPGGRVKHRIASFVHRLAERVVVGSCSGYMAVSEAYLKDIERRHGFRVESRPLLVAPFPAEPGEATRAAGPANCEQRVRPEGAQRTWRCIGRAGPDLRYSAKAFFQAWREAIDLGIIGHGEVNFDARGTSYARGSHEPLTFPPLTVGTTLADAVRETPARAGYKEMLTLLGGSDALLMFGSTDPTYTASRLYPYVLARRPLLAIFHERSPVVAIMRSIGGGVLVTFGDLTTTDELAREIRTRWFQGRQYETIQPLDWDALEPVTAEQQAKDVAAWIRDMLDRGVG